MALYRPGNSTTAHVSSESPGLGICFHSLKLTLSLVETGKKITVIFTLCTLFLVMSFTRTAQLLPRWVSRTLLPLCVWFLLEHRRVPNLALVFMFTACKMFLPSCTHCQLFLRTSMVWILPLTQTWPSASLTLSLQMLTMVSLQAFPCKGQKVCPFFLIGTHLYPWNPGLNPSSPDLCKSPKQSLCCQSLQLLLLDSFPKYTSLITYSFFYKGPVTPHCELCAVLTVWSLSKLTPIFFIILPFALTNIPVIIILNYSSLIFKLCWHYSQILTTALWFRHDQYHFFTQRQREAKKPAQVQTQNEGRSWIWAVWLWSVLLTTMLSSTHCLLNTLCHPLLLWSSANETSLRPLLLSFPILQASWKFHFCPQYSLTILARSVLLLPLISINNSTYIIYLLFTDRTCSTFCFLTQWQTLKK